jgi:hypothetical protein
MDWNLAIERNREALKRIVATLVAMAGLADSGPGTLPRHLHTWGNRGSESPRGRMVTD